jgi:hypothetical protein
MLYMNERLSATVYPLASRSLVYLHISALRANVFGDISRVTWHSCEGCFCLSLDYIDASPTDEQSRPCRRVLNERYSFFF